jgi:hypothetical protein
LPVAIFMITLCAISYLSLIGASRIAARQRPVGGDIRLRQSDSSPNDHSSSLDPAALHQSLVTKEID